MASLKPQHIGLESPTSPKGNTNFDNMNTSKNIKNRGALVDLGIKAPSHNFLELKGKGDPQYLFAQKPSHANREQGGSTVFSIASLCLTSSSELIKNYKYPPCA